MIHSLIPHFAPKKLRFYSQSQNTLALRNSSACYRAYLTLVCCKYAASCVRVRRRISHVLRYTRWPSNQHLCFALSKFSWLNTTSVEAFMYMFVYITFLANSFVWQNNCKIVDLLCQHDKNQA